MITHTGSLPGYVSRLTLIPEFDLGIVVLTNAEEGAAFEIITYHVLDHYLGAPAHDWFGAFRSVRDQRGAARRRRSGETAADRDSTSRPSLGLEDYAGVYRDAWYGDVRVEQEATGLVIRFSRTPVLVGDLDHWQHDTFLIRWRERELRADAFITFELAPSGRVREARMQPASPEVDFSYDFQDLVLIPRTDE